MSEEVAALKAQLQTQNSRLEELEAELAKAKTQITRQDKRLSLLKESHQAEVAEWQLKADKASASPRR